MAQFGEVVSVNIKKTSNGESRGFGFVTFADSDSAASALDKDVHVICGKQFGLREAENKVVTKDAPSIPTDPNRLWVGNLPSGVSEEMLIEYFSQFGPLKITGHGGSATTGIDFHGGDKAYAFVNFADTDTANACLGFSDQGCAFLQTFFTSSRLIFYIN